MATRGSAKKPPEKPKGKDDKNSKSKVSSSAKGKFNKEEIERMLGEKRRNDPKQQSKRSFADIARSVTKSKSSKTNDDPVMVKNAQNFMNAPRKSSTSVARSHSDAATKPNALFQRPRNNSDGPGRSLSNTDVRVSRSNSTRYMDSDNERRSRDGSFRNPYDDDDEFYHGHHGNQQEYYQDRNSRYYDDGVPEDYVKNRSGFKGRCIKI